MRVLLALLVACCSPVGPAAPGTNPPEAVATTEVSARDLLETMFIDNGALAASARRGFETSGQQIWESWANDPGFLSISAPRREAIRVYFADDYPREATEQVLRGAPLALDAAAPRVAALLNEAQIAQFDTFLQSEEARTWFVAAIAAGDGEYVPTAAESRSIDGFAARTRGEVWTEEFKQLVYQIAYDVMAYRAAAVRHGLFTRVCELAGDECPPGFVPEQ